MDLRAKLKSLFIKHFPNLEFGRILLHLPKIREFDFSASKHFNHKHELYEYVHNTFVSGYSMSYLEFGVYRGDSLKFWANIDKNKDSQFIGFDTFTGLPEDWLNLSGTMRKNHFDTNGRAPEIDDPRCSFVKGMFQDTLPNFLTEFKQKNKLVIHNDSDLYSSTLYTLTKIHPLLKPGAIIIFDEFSAALHEMRAFSDFTSSYLVKHKMIAHTYNYEQVAVEIL